MAESRSFGTFVKADRTELPLDRGFDRLTFLLPPGDKALIEGLKTHYPNGRLESRKALFRRNPVVYDRYIVEKEQD